MAWLGSPEDRQAAPYSTGRARGGACCRCLVHRFLVSQPPRSPASLSVLFPASFEQNVYKRKYWCLCKIKNKTEKTSLLAFEQVQNKSA